MSSVEQDKRGGARLGSGRKPKKNKKIGTQIYLTKETKEKIEMIDLNNCSNFSQKCNYLIDKGLREYLGITKSNTEQKVYNKEIKFIDLFSGMGGIRIGFNRALEKMGFKGKSVFVSEIKSHAINSYKSYFSEETIHGDITKIEASEIPDFDYLLAGFPCQAFSNAGNRLGFEDTRGTLFFDVARIIKEKKPKGFILENVEGLTTHDNGKTFSTIISVLEDLGYKTSYSVLDSKEFGLAQSRKRIYIIGNKNTHVSLENFERSSAQLKDIIDNDVRPEHDDFTNKLMSHYDVKEILGKQIKDKRGGDNNIHSWDFELKGEVSKEQKTLLELLLKQRRNKKWAEVIGIDWMDGMPLTLKMIQSFYENENLQEMLEDLVCKGYLAFEHPKKKVGNRRVYDETLEKGYNIKAGKLSFKFSTILDPNGVTPTIVATDMSKLAVPVENGIRSLTSREGLRLFGYPDDYNGLDKLDSSKAYDLLGNTVCVPVIEAAAKRLLEVTEKK